MKFGDKGPRTRRKRKGPSKVHHKKTVVFGWLGMGVKCSPVLPQLRTLTALCLIILGLFSDTVYACAVDMCWEQFERASETVGQGNSNSSSDQETRCIPFRTYFQCLENLHGCKGNIKFHSVKKVVRNRMQVNKCTSIGPVYKPGGEEIPILPPDALCQFQGKKVYRHCELFGDPHIRTFNSEFQTCKIQGAWPLVNNDHLTVQVTNDWVSESVAATAPSKLTVLIKKNEDCASKRYLTYQAQSDSNVLPSTFDDGRTHYGASRSVELVEKDPGKHIEIHIKYINTTILVRHIGSYLSFAISMPEELMNSTEQSALELCVRGCPRRELINYQEYLALREKSTFGGEIVMERKEAEEICRHSGLVDFYFDSCVFDLMTTGDKNFTLTAVASFRDILHLSPEESKNQKNRTSLDEYDKLYGSSATSIKRTSYSEAFRILTLTLIVCILTICESS